MPQGVSGKTAEMSQVDTPDTSRLAGQVESLVKLVERQSEQIEALRRQVEGLRALPAPPAKVDEAPVSESRPGKAQSFGDILARLEARQR